MKENVSPVIIAVIVILVIAMAAFFGMKTLGASRNSEPTADQIKQHMGAGMPQTGGMGRPGGPGGYGMPSSSGGPNGSAMPSSGVIPGR